jgi:outer membrane biosynthesis protein TonB
LGLSTVGARPVEQAAPPPKRRAIIEPAAAKPKSMSEPIKTAEKTKPPTPDPAKSPPKPAAAEVLQNYYSAETTSSVRKPVAGPKPAPGTSIAETGVQGLGAGLSSGGTGGVTLDVPFCCMDYVQVVVDKIREQWQNQPVKGTNIVKFTIEKSGAIDPTSIQIEQTSRNDSLDGESKRALYLARLPPLPQPFTGPRLTVHLTVVYGGS